jgi:hypothetical protein
LLRRQIFCAHAGKLGELAQQTTLCQFMCDAHLRFAAEKCVALFCAHAGKLGELAQQTTLC